MHAAALEVRVLDRVDVDRQPEGMHRPALRPGPNDVAAVEAGGVVVIERALVLPLVGVDRSHPPDRKALDVEPPENVHDLGDDAGVDHERPTMGGAFEAPVRQPHPPQLRRPDRAALVP